jgi:hypothetical protein
MKSFPLQGENAQPNSPFNYIINGAVGTPIILTQAPTSANGLVPEGELGIFGNDLYHTSGGVTRKYSGTQV